MLTVIFLSILLELFFIHVIVELYREKKINLTLFMIFFLMVATFLLRNLFTMNTYFYTSSQIENWYVEVMIFVVSMTLVGLVVMMKKFHRPLLMSDGPEVMTFEDALQQVPMKDIKLPFVIVNTDWKVVYMNESFSLLVKDNMFNLSDGLLFSTLFNGKLKFEALQELDQSVLKLKKSPCDEILVKLDCQLYDASGHIIVFFRESFTDQVLLQQVDALDERIDFYNNTLSVGTWEKGYDEEYFDISDRTKEILGIKENRCTVDRIKAMVHAEEVHAFEAVLTKAKWLKGRYDMDLRLYIDGKEKYVTLFYEAIFDQEGQPVKFKGFIQDLSRQRQAMYNRLLDEKYDVVGGIVQDINDKTYVLLEDLLEERAVDDYRERIQMGLEILETYKDRYLKEASQKNLVHCDKIIRQTVSKLSKINSDQFIDLNLNAHNSLVNINEESFEKILRNLLCDRVCFENKLSVIVESEESKMLFTENEYKYIIRMKTSKQDVSQEENESLKQRFYRVPIVDEETGLYHAYSIMKKYNGVASFYEDGLYYIFSLEFPSIQF
jgi:PAS domain-containing protein